MWKRSYRVPVPMPPKKKSRVEHDPPRKRKVILDHDGGIDDLVALGILLTQPHRVEMIGCIVTDADCYIDSGVSVTGKLCSLIRRKSRNSFPAFPIGRSTMHGVHPFPHEWRVDAKKMDDMPCLNVPKYAEHWDKEFLDDKSISGEELLARLVIHSETPVTICVTGPLSNVAFCITKYGSAFTKNVESVIIMGGAVDVKGNVFPPFEPTPTDQSAEWNFYWDAPAAQTVIRCPEIKKILFTLDATNSVPVKSDFVQQFGPLNGHYLAQFFGCSWATCTHMFLVGEHCGYYAWDALTAAFILDPSIAELRPVKLSIEVQLGHPSEGRSFRDEENGTECLVAKSADAQTFYSLMLSAATFV
jgi:purine nucleosidase